MAILYILCGIVLVVAFTGVLFYYFSPKRKKQVEAAKYEMLDDQDIPISGKQSDSDSDSE